MKAGQVLGTALTAAFMAGGCGSQNPPAATGAATSAPAETATAAGTPTNGGSGASAAADPTCALAPPHMVGAVLGGTVGQPSQAINRTSVATVVVCSYTTNSDHVTIRFQSKEDASGFAEGKRNFAASGQSVKNIAGFEDQAYVNTISLGGNSSLTTLVARKRTLEIEIVAQASLSREEALESKIFAVP